MPFLILLLLTSCILSGTLLLMLSDLHSNALLFDPIFGGDPPFYQHSFWCFGHLEVFRNNSCIWDHFYMSLGFYS